MKSKITATALGLLIVAYTTAISHASVASLPMKQSTAEKLRSKISEKSGTTFRPPREMFLHEDGLGRDFSISSVPEKVRRDAEHWIRQLVRHEWLPNDLPGMLRARKDALLREVKTSAGKVDFKDIGDFITLDFEASGHRIFLMESGRTVTARIHFPEEMDITMVTGGDILRIVEKFFTLPKSAIKPGDIKIEGDDQFRSFRWIAGPGNDEIARRYANGEPVEWWYRLHLYYDGRMLVISMPEIANPPQYTASMGLPDRF